jgi:hypothetical protein
LRGRRLRGRSLGIRRRWGAGGGAARRGEQPGDDNPHRPSRPTETTHGHYSFTRAWSDIRSHQVAPLLANARSIHPPRAAHDSHGRPKCEATTPSDESSSPPRLETHLGTACRADCWRPEATETLDRPLTSFDVHSGSFSMLNRGPYAGQYVGLSSVESRCRTPASRLASVRYDRGGRERERSQPERRAGRDRH